MLLRRAAQPLLWNLLTTLPPGTGGPKGVQQQAQLGGPHPTRAPAWPAQHSAAGPAAAQIQKGLIDMESMFELLTTRPAVDDAPGAAPLAITRGDVAFDNVTFRWAPSWGLAGRGRTGRAWGPDGQKARGCYSRCCTQEPGATSEPGRRGRSQLRATRSRLAEQSCAAAACVPPRTTPTLPAAPLMHARRR